MFNNNIEIEIINYYKNHNIKWSLLKLEWKEYLLQKWEDCNDIKESFFRILYKINQNIKK